MGRCGLPSISQSVSQSAKGFSIKRERKRQNGNVSAAGNYFLAAIIKFYGIIVSLYIVMACNVR